MRFILRKFVTSFACLAMVFGPAAGAFVIADSLGDRTSFEGGRSHAGENIDADLPGTEHIANIGSKVDGAGMCVMSSVEMCFRYVGEEEMRGLRDWCAQDAGGGWPEKVDKQIQAFCAQKKIKVPPYIQYEGRDPEPLIEAALKSGRMIGITYGWSPRYPGVRYIAHMTCCVKYSGRFAVVLDNNFIDSKEGKYEWMDKEELVRRTKYPSSTAWVFVPLTPPPPPSPRNK